MSPYTYTISLRINNPTSDLKEVYDSLTTISGAIVTPVKRAGTTRKDPKGKVLAGNYSESSFNLSFAKNWEKSAENSLQDSLREFVKKIMPFKDSIQSVVLTDGRLDFFIGVICGRNSGIVFSPDLLGQISALGIEIGLDIFSSNEDSSNAIASESELAS